MTVNPFEPPMSVEEPAVVGKHFDAMAALAEAWRAVIDDVGVAIIASLMFFSFGLAATVTGVGLFLLLPVFVWGGVRLILNMVDGIAGYTDLGEGFPRYWSVLGRTLQLGALYFLVFLPSLALSVGGAVLEAAPLVFAGQVAALLSWIALAPRFAFAPFFMVEQDLDAAQAMKASWQTTSYQKSRAILLVLLSSVIGAIGCGCLITGVVAIPVSLVMYAAAYRQMFPQP